MKPDDKPNRLEDDSLNEPQRLTKNFILGVASSMPFMAGGLIGCLLASEGQLMFFYMVYSRTSALQHSFSSYYLRDNQES